jgi:hypothetical protein
VRPQILHRKVLEIIARDDSNHVRALRVGSISRNSRYLEPRRLIKNATYECSFYSAQLICVGQDRLIVLLVQGHEGIDHPSSAAYSMQVWHKGYIEGL